MPALPPSAEPGQAPRRARSFHLPALAHALLRGRAEPPRRCSASPPAAAATRGAARRSPEMNVEHIQDLIKKLADELNGGPPARDGETQPEAAPALESAAEAMIGRSAAALETTARSMRGATGRCRPSVRVRGARRARRSPRPGDRQRGRRPGRPRRRCSIPSSRASPRRLRRSASRCCWSRSTLSPKAARATTRSASGCAPRTAPHSSRAITRASPWVRA